MAQSLHLRLGGVGAKGDAGGIAGNDARDREHQHRDADKHQQRGDKAMDQRREERRHRLGKLASGRCCPLSGRLRRPPSPRKRRGEGEPLRACGRYFVISTRRNCRPYSSAEKRLESSSKGGSLNVLRPTNTPLTSLAKIAGATASRRASR